jgi:hypothetical protein
MREKCSLPLPHWIIPYLAQFCSDYRLVAYQNARNDPLQPAPPLPHCHYHSVSHHSHSNRPLPLPHFPYLAQYCSDSQLVTYHNAQNNPPQLTKSLPHCHCHSISHNCRTSPDSRLVTYQNARNDPLKPTKPLPPRHCHSISHNHSNQPRTLSLDTATHSARSENEIEWITARSHPRRSSRSRWPVAVSKMLRSGSVAVGSGSGGVAVARVCSEWQCGHFGTRFMARVAVVVELW